MNITGTQSIAAPCERVWEALNDPAVLQRCLPGCESVARATPERFDVVMAVAIGPMRARFHGHLLMTDVNVPTSCTLAFQGQGGAVGFGNGGAEVQLERIAGCTELHYRAQAQVGGKLAQVGSRLIESVARKVANDFFEAFKTQLLPPAEAPTALPNPAPRPIGTTDHVPGWWLLIAAAAGSLATLSVMALAH